MDIREFNELAGATAQEFGDTGLTYLQFFMWAIRKQNFTYDLPVNMQPTLNGLGESPVKRMTGFLKTLKKEMDEGREILAMMQIHAEMTPETGITTPLLLDAFMEHGGFSMDESKKLALKVTDFMVEVSAYHLNGEQISGHELFGRFILVSLADWFADMSVYNRSEALKYGLPLESVQTIVMNSNFTKLGEDGLPIKDENGKFLKGPNFIAPERHIYAAMFDADEIMGQGQQILEQAEELTHLALPTLDDPMLEIHMAHTHADEEDDPDYSEEGEE
jgi:hypothetical protein